MSKLTLLFFIAVFLSVGIFFMPSIIYGAAFTTFHVNNPAANSVYNPGDVININGTVSSVVCYNSIALIDVRYSIGGVYWTGRIDVVGSTTLEWYNKITLPSSSVIPCGPQTLIISWEMPVYDKDTGALKQTDTGYAEIPIQIGQPGVCGTANGVISASAPIANLCSMGINSNVAEVGSFWKWKCSTAGECSTDSACSAPKTAVAVSCGTNGSVSPGKTYPAGTTTFFGTFCTNGATPIPANPPFPTIALPTTTWTCSGAPGVNCIANIDASGDCL